MYGYTTQPLDDKEQEDITMEDIVYIIHNGRNPNQSINQLNEEIYPDKA